MVRMAVSLELYLDLTEDSGSLQKAPGVTCTHNTDFAKDLRPLEIHYYVVLVKKMYEIKIYNAHSDRISGRINMIRST